MAGWFENQLRDAAGAFFGSDYLRDFQHASKTFRPNSYQNAPKLKFLFHVYFEINPEAFIAFNGGRTFTNVNEQTNFGLLVKEVKLPSYTFQTAQLNQYNRKRIVNTKIKYDPVDITFHDDNGDTINGMWQAYYQYYFNDGSKVQGLPVSGRNTEASATAESPGPSAAYNTRNIYSNVTATDQDWGYNGVPVAGNVKIPFFKRITVFGLNQHNYTAYTLINPVITNFQHDQYNYSEGGGAMQNRMTIDYETVVYDYGALSGDEPGNFVTGFGDQATYDRYLSPIARPGSTATILGQGGLVSAVTGTLDALAQGNILGAIKTAGTAYNTFKNVNLKSTVKAEVQAGLMNAVTQTPNTTRNTLFNIPTLGAVPSNVNRAGSPVTGGLASPPAVTNEPVAGSQYNGTNLTTSYPPPGP